jgi:hypothetical protein
MNTSRLVGVDGTDGSSVSDGSVRGRQEVEQLFAILRDHFPGFGNACIKDVASMLGIRETRRILGAYELTVADLVEDAEFADTVGFSIYGWDLPDSKRPSEQPLVDESTGRYVNKVQKALSTPIPYRSLLPRPIENLICMGRAISVERDVLGPLRVMAPCMAMGEAAGTAAAQVVGGKIGFAEVDVGRLRSAPARAGSDRRPVCPAADPAARGP